MFRQIVAQRATRAGLRSSRSSSLLSKPSPKQLPGQLPAQSATPARERYRFAPLPSLMAIVLIASCAPGEDPIEPSVSTGNSALVRADFESVQRANDVSLSSSEGVRSSGLAATTAGAIATTSVATSAPAAASASNAAQSTDIGSGKGSGGALASDTAVATATEVPEQNDIAPTASAADAQGSATTPVASTRGSLETFAADALAAINAARAQSRSCGDKSFPAVGPLTWNARTAYAAMLETEWMQSTNSFGHVWPTGERVWDRLQMSGYLWAKADENIAAGFRTLDAAMKAWIDSPPHCVALMRADLSEVGVSVVPGNDGNTYLSYWAMVLATPQVANPQ